MATTNKIIVSSVIIGLFVYGLTSLLTGYVTTAIYAWSVCILVCIVGSVTFIQASPEHPAKSLYNRSAARAKSTTHYTDLEWRALCVQYKNRCICCSKKRRLTADHVMPLSLGGSDDISNIQPLCQPCNSSKGTRIIDYRMKP